MAQLIPYDDRDGHIWLNGEMVAWREAKVHVLTHALHYGSSVFEGERYDGRIFKSTEHSQRLIDSGRILGFEVPYSVGRARCRQGGRGRQDGLQGLLCPPGRLAGRSRWVSGPAVAHHRRDRGVEWGAYYSDLRLTRAIYDRPAPNTAPVHAKAAGLYMICTVASTPPRPRASATP